MIAHPYIKTIEVFHEHTYFIIGMLQKIEVHVS
jgi:hypothetical protein